MNNLIKKMCKSPGWVAQLLRESSQSPKGCGFNSPPGRIPRLCVRSPVRACTGGYQSMFLSHINVSVCLSLPLSPPSSLSIVNKYIPLVREKNFKWAKTVNRNLTKKYTRTAKKKKHMKRCSTSYIIRELQIKITMISSTQPLKWPKSKILTIPTADKDVEQQKFSLNTGGNAKCYSHFGKHFGSFLQT